MYSFHKQDKIFASDLYGRLQWLAYRPAIVNAHTDLPLIFYLLLTGMINEICYRIEELNITFSWISRRKRCISPD